MNFFLRILLIAALTFLVGYYLPLPWWSLVIAAFLVGFIFGKKPPRRRLYGKQKAHRPFSFWAGFLGVFLLWGGWALWLNQENGALLSSQVVQLFPVPAFLESLGAYFLVLITALMGGLLGGFASLTGNYLGEMVK